MLSTEIISPLDLAIAGAFELDKIEALIRLTSSYGRFSVGGGTLTAVNNQR